MTLLAEDLLWLLLDDHTGEPLVDKQSLSHALAGALLIDLAAPQHFPALVRVSGPGEPIRRGRSWSPTRVNLLRGRQIRCSRTRSMYWGNAR
jgi:hypothetical protein